MARNESPEVKELRQQAQDRKRLEEAAPDLLAVAEYFLSPLPFSTIDFYGWFARGTEMARQAIAKARPEPTGAPK